MTETFDAYTLARQLGALTQGARVHDVGNRAVSRLVRWTAQAMEHLAASDPEARIEIDGGVLVVNGHHVRLRREMRSQLAPLGALLRERGAGGLRVLPGVDIPAVEALYRGFSTVAANGNREAFQAWLDEHGAASFRLLPPRVLLTGSLGGAGVSVRTVASEVLQAYVRAVVAVHRAVSDGTLARLPSGVQKAMQRLAELAQEEPRMHLGLASIKSDTDYEARHPVHSAILAMALGARLGLERRALVELAYCVLLVAVLPPDGGGALRLHEAAKLVSTARLSPQRVRRILVLVESGLAPDRSGEADLPLVGPLHLYSRIASLVCAYDDRTTHRDDQAAVLPDEALADLLASGRHDVELLRVFSAMLGRYPLGSGVRLDTGEIAVVYHTSADPALADRPVVRIVRDHRGRPLEEGQLVDLGAPDEARRVVRGVDLAAFGIDGERALYG